MLLAFLVVLSVALTVLVSKLIKDDRRQKSAMMAHQISRSDFCAVTDLIDFYGEDQSEGVTKIMKLMPHCLRTDRAFRAHIDEEGLQLNEHRALQMIAYLDHNALCEAINQAQDDGFEAEAKLRALLPECQRIDSQIVEFFDSETQGEYLCLESFVRHILGSGDIEASVPVA